MPDFSGSLNDISTNTVCADKGGLLTVYWIPESDIDWSTVTWDDAGYAVTAWAMLAMATWNKIEFERTAGRLDALYTEENGYYEVSLLNLLFSGHSAARSVAIGQAIPVCNIVAQVFDNNGNARILGKEYDSGAWVNPLKNCRITRHLDTTGGFGAADDKARDEFDLTAQHLLPLPYSTVSLSTMETLL